MSLPVWVIWICNDASICGSHPPRTIRTATNAGGISWKLRIIRFSKFHATITVSLIFFLSVTRLPCLLESESCTVKSVRQPIHYVPSSWRLHCMLERDSVLIFLFNVEYLVSKWFYNHSNADTLFFAADWQKLYWSQPRSARFLVFMMVNLHGFNI